MDMNERSRRELWLKIWMTVGFAVPLFSMMFMDDPWEDIQRLIRSAEFRQTGWIPVLTLFLLEGLGLLCTLYLGPKIDLRKSDPHMSARIFGGVLFFALIGIMGFPLLYFLYFLSLSGIDTTGAWLFTAISVVVYFFVAVAQRKGWKIKGGTPLI
jgi:drug/metabolite transporter (DMT)-like permease